MRIYTAPTPAAVVAGAVPYSQLKCIEIYAYKYVHIHVHFLFKIHSYIYLCVYIARPGGMARAVLCDSNKCIYTSIHIYMYIHIYIRFEYMCIYTGT